MSHRGEDVLRMARRNMLLGMWAAKKLNLDGERAKAYSDDLAMGTLDFERSDVLRKIRDDFKAAGVVQSDEDILRVMTESWLQASSPKTATRGDATDAAVVQIARNFISK
ncbi:ATPase inhibitor subunit zeta (plasmid) [Ensifer adhaerens]|uniref:ATPase inhibitor subunit zeta n=1 Tax=Ensifer adhaerens TaxID=106592 RepID=UPI0023A9CC0C|nr:ATPase inhibitor subunit zeta [Ensifer adhaerens]WDZ80251.1 ATPase inhibitor subunit zeta [Ensifer adhaerens]